MTFMREIKDLCKEYQVDTAFVEELETLIRSRMLHVAYQKILHDSDLYNLEPGQLQHLVEEEAKQGMMREIWKYAKHECETMELGQLHRYRVTILTEDLGKAKH